jgi:hypothetical protein
MYAAPCQHSLYGPGCHPGAESPSFPGPGYEEHTQVYNVVSVNPVYPLQIFTLNLWDPTALFALGFITFSSGLNYLLRRTIKRVDGDTITLMSPLPNIPEIGAIVALTHGCDKSQSTCLNKFNNLNNFGGFPYIPHETVFFIFSVLCLITGLIWKEIG